MTEKELLLDTIGHYTSNNRCRSKGKCRYSPITLGLEGTSEGCAIGRLLDPDLARQIDEKEGAITIEELVETKYSLPDWMKQMSPAFLSRIQGLHDSDFNWNESGLSEVGKSRVQFICRDYNIELN